MGQACCTLKRRSESVNPQQDGANDLTSNPDTLPEVMPVSPAPLSTSDQLYRQLEHARSQGGQRMKRRNRLIKPLQKKRSPTPTAEPSTFVSPQLQTPPSPGIAVHFEPNPWDISSGEESDQRQYLHRDGYRYDGSADDTADREVQLIAPTPCRPVSLNVPMGMGNNGVGLLEAQVAETSVATPVTEGHGKGKGTMASESPPPASRSPSVYYQARSYPNEVASVNMALEGSDDDILHAVMEASRVSSVSPSLRPPSQRSQDSNATVVRTKPLMFGHYSDPSATDNPMLLTGASGHAAAPQATARRGESV